MRVLTFTNAKTGGKFEILPFIFVFPKFLVSLATMRANSLLIGCERRESHQQPIRKSRCIRRRFYIDDRNVTVKSSRMK